MGEGKIDAELACFADNFSFRKLDERRVNLKAPAFDPGFCPESGQGLKRFDEFRSAIGIAAVIDRVYAEKNVIGRNYFCPRNRVSQKDGVARRDVGDGNP